MVTNPLGDDALRAKADWVRRETLLLHMRCPGTRLASSLSCVEILVALHYGGVLAFDPARPHDPDRDRFIASKGHGTISFYPILADLGFTARGELERIGRPEGLFKIIPDPLIPGYETLNGSLGHGPGTACGIALALRARGSAAKVFALVGDGELNEGSVWEAVMFAAHHKLDNLVLVVDRNGRCMLDYCRHVIDLDPLAEKFRAFGWGTAEVADGHDLRALRAALLAAKSGGGGPRAVIAHTVKGRGVPSLEADRLAHVRALTAEEAAAAAARIPA